MPRFGITGHVHLTPGSVPLIQDALVEALRPFAGPGLTGVSCIAQGADAIFAQAVLDLGGRLEIVIPSADYESMAGADYIARYKELRERAASARELEYVKASRDAYEAANRELLDSSLDRLFAVWDGKADPAKGNTASVVELAREKGVPVEIVWPDGAERSGNGS